MTHPENEAARTGWHGQNRDASGAIVHPGWTRVRIVASGVVEGVAVFRCEDRARRRLVLILDTETMRGRAQLNELCSAARVSQPSDTAELHGREVLARVRGNRIVSTWRVGE